VADGSSGRVGLTARCVCCCFAVDASLLALALVAVGDQLYRARCCDPFEFGCEGSAPGFCDNGLSRASPRRFGSALPLVASVAVASVVANVVALYCRACHEGP
jgi:hypothetical protein